MKFFGLFDAEADFFASYRFDKEYRTITRLAFQFEKSELRDLTNAIIRKYTEIKAPEKTTAFDL